MSYFDKCFGFYNNKNNTITGHELYVGFISKTYEGWGWEYAVVYGLLMGIMNIKITMEYTKCYSKTSLLNYLVGWSWINYLFLVPLINDPVVNRFIIFVAIMHQYMEAGLADNYYLIFRNYLDSDNGHLLTNNIKLTKLEAYLYRGIKLLIYTMIFIDIFLVVYFDSLTYGIYAFYTASLTDTLFITFGILCFIKTRTKFTFFTALSCLSHVFFASTVFVTCAFGSVGGLLWLIFYFFQQLSILFAVYHHQNSVGTTSLINELLFITDYELL